MWRWGFPLILCRRFWQRPIQRMQRDTSGLGIKLVEPLAMGTEGSCVFLLLSLLCRSSWLTFLAEIGVDRFCRGGTLLFWWRQHKGSFSNGLPTFKMWFHLLLYLSFPWVAQLTEGDSWVSGTCSRRVRRQKQSLLWGSNDLDTSHVLLFGVLFLSKALYCPL